MGVTPIRLACVMLLGTTFVAPAWAEGVASSASSATSSAGSASLGSSSNSIGDSSRASSPDRQTADGDYRVIDVADADAKPGVMLLRLRATQGEAHEFTLKLPREALGRRGIAVGDVVHARNRAYGVEFARANAAQVREAFFLVLADDWHKELDARAVAL